MQWPHWIFFRWKIDLLNLSLGGATYFSNKFVQYRFNLCVQYNSMFKRTIINHIFTGSWIFKMWAVAFFWRSTSTSLTAFRRRLKAELFLRCFGPDCVWRIFACARLWMRTFIYILLGPFYGAIAVPSVTRCRCRRGHRCAGGVRQYR